MTAAVASFGDISKFCGRVVWQVYNLRVFRFFGEALRQAGILIISSTLVIWGLVFIIGLQCGIEGAPTLREKYAPSIPHWRPRMNTRPQITSVEPRIRIPAWRSASPKKRKTRPE